MQSGWLKGHLKPTRPEETETADQALPEAAPESPGLSRRDFIRGGLAAGAVAGLGGSSLFALHATAHAQPAPPRFGATPSTQGQTGQFWPSRWGSLDQAGASNWITPRKVRQVAKMIRTGQILDIGRVYEAGIPAFGTRTYSFRILAPSPGAPTGGPLGANALIYHDDFLSTEIGQVGTQFDGLGHVGIQMGAPGDFSQMYYYNGWTQAEIGHPSGLRALGMEYVKPIFTRGVLIDVAGLYGGMLPGGYEITLSDVRQALARQGVSERRNSPGDAYFFNTGWGSLWMVDNAQFLASAPGIGLEVAGWLIAQDAVVAGADTWPLEVVPNPDPNLAFPVHQELIPKNGIFIHENLDFSTLLMQGVYEFVYNFAPIRFRGGTGSPGRPTAIL